MNERFKELIDYLILQKYVRNQQEFTEKVKSDKSTVSQIKTGKLNIPNKLFANVCSAFPFINIDWIKTGEGVMLTSEVSTVTQIGGHSDKQGTPYYDVDFLGGFEPIANNQSVAPAYYITFPQFDRADCWVNITGQSMEPAISHGDIVAIRELSDWDTYLLFGEIYAIVTDEYRTVKKVRRSSKGDSFLRIVPINKDFDEQDIPKSAIRKVFQVLGATKRIF